MDETTDSAELDLSKKVEIDKGKIYTIKIISSFFKFHKKGCRRKEKILCADALLTGIYINFLLIK